MVPGKPLWSVDIRGGQRGSLVENGAQSALGRRTIKRRVPEWECARCFQKQHVAMTKCCHRPCAPSGRSMTPASRLAPFPPRSIIHVTRVTSQTRSLCPRPRVWTPLGH